MGDVTPANPLWWLLLLALGLFGYSSIEAVEPEERPDWENPAPAPDTDSDLVRGALLTTAEDGTVGPAPRGAEVFAVPAELTPMVEQMQTDLPEDWRDQGGFTFPPEAVQRLKGDHATATSRAGEFELTLPAAGTAHLICYAERDHEVLGCTEAVLLPNRSPYQLIWTGDELTHRP